MQILKPFPNIMFQTSTFFYPQHFLSQKYCIILNSSLKYIFLPCSKFHLWECLKFHSLDSIPFTFFHRTISPPRINCVSFTLMLDNFQTNIKNTFTLVFIGHTNWILSKIQLQIWRYPAGTDQSMGRNSKKLVKQKFWPL